MRFNVNGSQWDCQPWFNDGVTPEAACSRSTKVESCALHLRRGPFRDSHPLAFAICALLLAAAAFAAPAAAAPATGADALFHRRRPVQPRGRDRSADQPRRTHHRLRPPVQRHHDRPARGSTIWLVDVATGAAAPAARRLGLLFLAALVARRHAACLRRRRQDGSPQLYVRWMASGESARITGLPDSPSAIAWSPDGRRIAYSMFVPDEGTTLGTAPPKPEGAKWADPLQVITAVTYRADGAGYLKPGYGQIFWVPADGGAPTQLTFGATNAGGQVSWTPDGRSILFSANLAKDWEREPNDSEIYRVGIDGGAPVALTNRKGPDGSPVVSPDGRHDRLCRLRRPPAWLPERPAFGDEPRRLRQARCSPAASTAPSAVPSGPPTAARSTSSTTTTAATRSRASASTARSAKSRRASPAQGSTGPMPAASSASRATARWPSPTGDPLHPSDVGVASGGGVRHLTHLNEQLAAKALAQVAEARRSPRASTSARSTRGWSLRPTSIRRSKYPLILEIHGGP